MSATTTVTRAARADKQRRRRITGRALALLLVVGALLFAASYPLRTYLHERSQIGILDQQVTQLQRQNADLDHSIAQMRNPEYVERFARECLGMIKPGEIPFVVVPKHGQAGAPVC